VFLGNLIWQMSPRTFSFLFFWQFDLHICHFITAEFVGNVENLVGFGGCSICCVFQGQYFLIFKVSFSGVDWAQGLEFRV